MVRVTGFGQSGPYKDRAGFGTLAEAMSGFAHITGTPSGPPTLPPFGLADGIAAHYGCFSTMFALYERDAKGSGKGQFIDLAIYEPIFALLGYQPTLYDQLGIIQTRTGNRSVNNAPRNTYCTKKGRYVALSASTPAITDRVLRLCGGDAFADDPRFKTASERIKYVEEIDDVGGGWVGRHTPEEVLAEFEKAGGAIVPVYDIKQIFEDPHFAARRDIVELPDAELGIVKLQNAFPFMSRTPGKIRHAGPALAAQNEEINRGDLGFGDDELADLRREGALPPQAVEVGELHFAPALG